jgi:hypothetical protein
MQEKNTGREGRTVLTQREDSEAVNRLHREQCHQRRRDKKRQKKRQEEEKRAFPPNLPKAGRKVRV